MSFEKQLGNLLGYDDDTRVQLVQVGEASETPTLELRLERHAGDLGWQTQRRIRMAAGQIGALRDAINLMDRDARDSHHPGRTSGEESNVIELTALRRQTS